jgi:hypothetical protein
MRRKNQKDLSQTTPSWVEGAEDTLFQVEMRMVGDEAYPLLCYPAFRLALTTS